VTQLGTRIHVLLADDADAAEAVPAMLGRLAESGLEQPRVSEAEPNLEDVFVACGLARRTTAAPA
jgi:hypothetical protein